MRPGHLAQRLAQVAAEVEERHEYELAELQGRLRQAEDERVNSQMVCLRLEAQVQESSAHLERAEAALREAREENARLQHACRESKEERTVEAAQLSRINELSRELIATRFELASLATKSGVFAGGAEDASPLGMEALLEAASSLDLQAADAILNLVPPHHAGRRDDR